MLQKIFTGFDGARNWLQINKNYIPFYLPSHGEFENSCFVSIILMVRVSRAFVYNIINVKTKSPSYMNPRLT